MKKVLIALCFMLGFAGIASAQTARKKASAATKIERVKPAAAATGISDVPKKADGTRDRRFKATRLNRETELGALKKDGAPGKRFAKNKKKG